MGGFNPVSKLLAMTGLYQSYDDSAGDYRAAKKQYEANELDIVAKDAQARAQLALESAEETRKRREALRRTVSKQRANFGAQGIETSEGSGQAVMLGLFEESDAEKQYRDRLDTLKRAALDQDTDTKRRKNLLSLQSARSSARGSAIDDVTSLFD
jgi:hypothetical protein